VCPSLYPERSRAWSGYACGVVNATLTDVAIRAWIKAGERVEGCTDGDGLPLSWRPDRTAPHWRLRDRFAGKSRVMNSGSYTDLPLAAARQSAKELRAKIALGRFVAGEEQERKSTALARIEAARSVTTVGQLADDDFEVGPSSFCMPRALSSGSNAATASSAACMLASLVLHTGHVGSVNGLAGTATTKRRRKRALAWALMCQVRRLYVQLGVGNVATPGVDMRGLGLWFG
jgi:hypothetical protein